MPEKKNFEDLRADLREFTLLQALNLVSLRNIPSTMLVLDSSDKEPDWLAKILFHEGYFVAVYYAGQPMDPISALYRTGYLTHEQATLFRQKTKGKSDTEILQFLDSLGLSGEVDYHKAYTEDALATLSSLFQWREGTLLINPQVSSSDLPIISALIGRDYLIQNEPRTVFNPHHPLHTPPKRTRKELEKIEALRRRLSDS